MCQLYITGTYDGYNPNKESEKGNVNIKLSKKYHWMADYVVSCERCNREFDVEEREGHYTWSRWKYKNTLVNQNLPKKIIKHVEYLKESLKASFEVQSIEYLSRLPKEIWYISWSIGHSEVDRSFRIIAKNRSNEIVELYAQTNSLFGWIYRTMYWQKIHGKMKRIKVH